MIRFKTKTQERQFNSRDMCPYLYWKVNYMARRAEDKYGIDLVITSVYRHDESSHGHTPYRAVDIRVAWKGERVIPVKIVKLLKAYHDKKIRRFGTYDSFFEHEVKDRKGRSRGTHIHSQRPKKITLT